MPQSHDAQKRRCFPAWSYGSLSILVLLAAVAVTPTLFGAAATVTVDAAKFDQLLQRLTALEAEVQQLKAQPAARPADVAVAPVPVPAPVAAAPEERYPQIDFSLLGDITYHANSHRADRNTFALGDVDPVVTAKLSPRTSVLGDFVIAGDQDGFAFETERLIMRYHVNDAVNVEAGRFHNDIGYYNTAFKNGTYFQTTVERPAIFLFEDGEGILPIHGNGVSVSGELPSGQWNARYSVQLTNGRDYDHEANPFRIEDDNSYKAVSAAFSVRPEFLSGLTLGASVYHDVLTIEEQPRIHQWVFGGYGVYRTPTIEWLNEVLVVRHAPVTGRAYDTVAGYSQFSQKFGAFRPYARVQWRNSHRDDPVLTEIGQNTSIWGTVAGVRYDFTPMMALKAELEHSEARDEKALDELFLQWTFRY